jgi:CHAT domain-containing protein
MSGPPTPRRPHQFKARTISAPIPKTHLYIGSKATEAEVKELSNDGMLAKFKIVHFATHGALAGQLSPNAEPERTRSYLPKHSRVQ